ncbi:hypothetical protein [Sphingobacterium suaedae]|uniref:Uncharacterized protein n=1 Tax=Sphingobacterium suaedae TaxID=1686402 RepID=A0ABW5KL54_9SPHI
MKTFLSKRDYKHMELFVPERRIKIIKSVEDRHLGTFTEEVFKECDDDTDVLLTLKDIERHYSADPNFELLHGIRERLSISFRDLRSQQEVRFIVQD